MSLTESGLWCFSVVEFEPHFSVDEKCIVVSVDVHQGAQSTHQWLWVQLTGRWRCSSAPGAA